MRPGNVALLALAASLVAGGGCNSSAPQPGSKVGGEGKPADSTAKPNLSTGNSLCNPVCEEIAYSKRMDPSSPRKIGLQPEESASLKAALASTVVSGNADKVHLHADAIKDRLVFAADNPNDSSREAHVSNPDSQVSVSSSTSPGSSRPVTVVTTPAAMQLLQQRAEKRAVTGAR